MKTWLEDNWLNKLDRIDISERLLEAEREITGLSLLPDNISNFPELYNTLFPEKNPLLANKPYYVPGKAFLKHSLIHYQEDRAAERVVRIHMSRS